MPAGGYGGYGGYWGLTLGAYTVDEASVPVAVSMDIVGGYVVVHDARLSRKVATWAAKELVKKPDITAKTLRVVRILSHKSQVRLQSLSGAFRASCHHDSAEASQCPAFYATNSGLN